MPEKQFITGIPGSKLFTSQMKESAFFSGMHALVRFSHRQYFLFDSSTWVRLSTI